MSENTSRVAELLIGVSTIVTQLVRVLHEKQVIDKAAFASDLEFLINETLATSDEQDPTRLDIVLMQSLIKSLRSEPPPLWQPKGGGGTVSGGPDDG